jgi:hypothetical protein
LQGGSRSFPADLPHVRADLASARPGRQACGTGRGRPALPARQMLGRRAHPQPHRQRRHLPRRRLASQRPATQHLSPPAAAAAAAHLIMSSRPSVSIMTAQSLRDCCTAACRFVRLRLWKSSGPQVRSQRTAVMPACSSSVSTSTDCEAGPMVPHLGGIGGGGRGRRHWQVGVEAQDADAGAGAARGVGGK